MPSPQIVAVMIHVPDPVAGLCWYETAFPTAIRENSELHDFTYLRLGMIQIEIVRSDEKVSAGANGSVVYWHAQNLTREVARLRELGATLYRRPMQIEDGLAMCQVRDPWGNCIGLRGPIT